MLDKIIISKKKKLKEIVSIDYLRKLENKILKLPSPKDFKESLKREKGEKIKIIAEIKRASPSKGLIAENFEPKRYAGEYERAGAAAVSVLTEEDYFLGSLMHLNEVRSVCSLPILRKDFILHPVEIYEARAYGSDAVLLIVKILDKKSLKALLNLTRELEMQALVEVHSEKELELALEVGAEIIGINNRNLEDFTVDFRVTERLAELIPNDKVAVSESGIKHAREVRFLEALGIDAILVGETLMRSPDPYQTLKNFLEE
ncbi:MAG: Indole-3-glycerol phosphate synthase [Clostridia bacterium 41_269]|nr:MAG: Indole-3-glycerol phosphate synthase [Clostridia bacterium 41_269]